MSSSGDGSPDAAAVVLHLESHRHDHRITPTHFVKESPAKYLDGSSSAET